MLRDYRRKCKRRNSLWSRTRYLVNRFCLINSCGHFVTTWKWLLYGILKYAFLFDESVTDQQIVDRDSVLKLTSNWLVYLNSNIANKRVQSIVLEVFNSKYKLKIIVFDVINCEWKFYSNHFKKFDYTRRIQQKWMNHLHLWQNSPQSKRRWPKCSKDKMKKSDSRKFQIEIKRPSIDLVHRRCTPNYFPEITV